MTINKISNIILSETSDYKDLLEEIKLKLKSSQLKAALYVNSELINFYWDVGKMIVYRQENSNWGDKLFEVLARDLAISFPNMQGFSKTNLKNMRSFYMHYKDKEFSQALPDQLSWTHHIVLIQTIDKEDITQKQWYAIKIIENGWGYRQLQEQIKLNLYKRQAIDSTKQTNFHNKLPSPTSRLAHEMIKDPYKFHFLTVGNEALEKDIQNGLVNHIRQFLMELGQGFAFYGAAYPIIVSGKRFEIDLLFYHTRLHAYIVVELLCVVQHKMSYVV